MEDREGKLSQSRGDKEELVPSLQLRDREEDSSSGSDASVVLYESRV